MTRRKLPIGVQTFREIREEHCYYVDKTAYIGRLLDEAKHYFLSRPRRFGKSLFLDTCKELFEGNEPLFEGLAPARRRFWSIRCFRGGSVRWRSTACSAAPSCCRPSTSATCRPRRCCSRPAT